MNQVNLVQCVNTPYGLLKLNYKTVQTFLKRLCQFLKVGIEDQTDYIFVDFQIYPNCLMLTERTEKILKKYFDQSFFVRKNTIYSTQLLKEYFQFKKKVDKKVIQVGSVVKLILDGGLYHVDSLDLQKKLATISKKDKKGTSILTLKVHLDNLILAYHFN